MEYKQAFLDKIDYIIWDWNGTIINDVVLCVDIMNQLLEEYNLPKIGLKTYRRVFTFPVKEYYERLGFDFERVSFDDVGNKFIKLYNKNFSKIRLQPGAEDLLKQLKARGKKQILISARNHSSLLKDVSHFALDGYFDAVIGLDDDLARGKEHLVEKFFEENSLDPKKTLFIGDTLHDCEIAKNLGAHYFMVANGHQGAGELMLCTSYVYANLLSLADFLFNA